ncbi:GalNAc(5)-diNAcBac-PP-undecaprenol beta-1,3-glucosyltransferase [compost metagenome]
MTLAASSERRPFESPHVKPSPLVSITIPAFNPRFFRAALQGALNQSYENLEIIVCDDRRDDEIEQIVEALATKTDKPVRYLRNPQPLGLQGNLLRCLEEARGQYIKFLCDDDRLMPHCIERQAKVLDVHDDVSLAGAQRYLCDSDDHLLPPRLENCCFSPIDAVFKGGDILAILKDSPVNFIGGLSSVLLRRSDVLALLPAVAQPGQGFVALLDLALFACLLRRGNLAIMNQVQSFERIHPDRLKKQAPVAQQEATELQWLGQMLEARGSEPAPAHGWVRYVPLGQTGERKWEELCLSRLLSLQQTIVHWKVGSQAESFSELYAQWLSCRQFSAATKRQLPERIAGWSQQPKIVPVVVDSEGDSAALQVTLQSIAEQSYAAEATLVLSCNGRQNGVSERTLTMVLQDSWPRQLNEVLPQLDGADWFYLLRAGDRLTESALLLMAERIAANHGVRCCYSDEGALREQVSAEPVFKPDFNLDLLRGYPYVGRALALQRQRFIELGGFNPEFDELSPHDLLWRLVENDGLQVVEHISEILLESQQAYATWLSSPAVIEHNPRVLAEHLRRLGIEHRIERGSLPMLNRVHYNHGAQPRVSIIIATRDERVALQRCVETLIEKTAYNHYEILIVDNASRDPEARAWLQAMADMGSDMLRVLRYDASSNVAALFNFAAGQARGEYLLLLSPHSMIFNSDWLGELLNHAQRPEVGVVGAKLISPQGTIAGAGLLLGLRGPVGTPFIGEPAQARGYMQRLHVAQNYSAVSGECLMVRKQVFDDLGALDEATFSQSFSDVDLCLRVRNNGYLVVWTPDAQVVFAELENHTLDPQSEKQRQQVDAKEQESVLLRWLPVLARDPAYNRNLGLTGSSFCLEPGLRAGWDPLTQRMQPNVLAMPMNLTAVGHYRVVQPFIELEAANRIGGHMAFEMPSILDIERQSPDVIILQGRYSEGPINEIERLKTYSRAFRIFELDDYVIKVPKKNGHLRNMPEDMEQTVRRGIGLCDRLVVSTQALADALAGSNSDIRVVPNMLAPHLWHGLRGQRRTSSKPRVGWGGGTSHAGDLEIIAEVVRELAHEVEWVFFGMCPEALRPYIHEFHSVIGLEAYPAKLASLNLDLALAPLEHHIFNDCKSNLRLLEYGACGYPVICSDTEAYRGYLPCTRVVSNSTSEWLQAIRMHLSDREASYRMGDELREVVLRDYMLQGDNLQPWFDGWMPD